MADAKRSDDATHNRPRKRHAFVTAYMTDEDAKRITASLPTEKELRTGRWAWQSDEAPSGTKKV